MFSCTLTHIWDSRKCPMCEIQRLEQENKKLRQFIASCRCEECGNELGEKWSLINGNLCHDCFEQYQDDL
jgi:hypothetical protein